MAAFSFNKLPQLFHAISDPALAQVVWGHFDLDLVARQDADVVLPHAPGDVRDDFVAVLELHPEHGVRERLGDRALEFNDVIFGHAFPVLTVVRRRDGGVAARKVEHSDTLAGGQAKRQLRAGQAGATPRRLAERVPKRVAQCPGGSASMVSAATCRRKTGRGQASAPRLTRCAFSTWASISGQPHPCNRWARAASATLEPPVSALNMLSPKNIRPIATPKMPPTSRGPSKTSTLCAWPSRCSST